MEGERSKPQIFVPVFNDSYRALAKRGCLSKNGFREVSPSLWCGAVLCRPVNRRIDAEEVDAFDLNPDHMALLVE